MSDAPGKIYFTSLRDCLKRGASILLPVCSVVILWELISYFFGDGGILPSTRLNLLWLFLGLLASLLFGLLDYFFAWLWRVKVTAQGITARRSRYSVAREFSPWSNFDSARLTAIGNQWPCIVVTGTTPPFRLYLMVQGANRILLWREIVRLAPPSNVLACYLRSRAL